MTDWRPELPPSADPIYARIVEALAADIDRGALPEHTRLPTQRALAEQLGVGVGTVTRAYVEAEARGLLDATVGRGSFVAARARPRGDGPIELSRNVPPFAPAEAALRRGMAAIARRGDLVDLLDYAPPGGMPAARAAGAVWLERTSNFSKVDPERLICCAGAQQAIMAALGALCRPGEALIVEEATFAGLRSAASLAGLNLVGVAMDAEGITPAALDQAAMKSGARTAYVLPFQNPTARVMSLDRRRTLVAVARRRNLTLIEDDLYGAYAAELGLPPLAELAPDRVAYVSGLSKSLAPGLRVGFLLPPASVHGRALEAVRAMAFGSPTFGGVLATQWIEDGEAFAILDAVRDEIATRTTLARAVLGEAMASLRLTASPHVWLPMDELAAERVAGAALRAGAQVTPPKAPYLTGAPVAGLRVCLGAAPDQALLRRGLETVARSLGSGALAEDVV